MSSNHKLTALLKGRTIAGTQNQNDRMTITFTDGSALTARTAGSNNRASTGGTVACVRQQGTELSLDFTDGSSLLIPTAEATSSVMVRAQDDTLEYAD